MFLGFLAHLLWGKSWAVVIARSTSVSYKNLKCSQLLGQSIKRVYMKHGILAYHNKVQLEILEVIFFKLYFWSYVPLFKLEFFSKMHCPWQICDENHCIILGFFKDDYNAGLHPASPQCWFFLSYHHDDSLLLSLRKCIQGKILLTIMLLWHIQGMSHCYYGNCMCCYGNTLDQLWEMEARVSWM